MRRFFFSQSQAFCIVLAMAVLSPALGQTKTPLLGKTREQVMEQLGEPKSNIRVGAREMLFFPKVKVTLRNDVVIETEDLPEEPASAPVPPPAAKHPAETAATSEPHAGNSPAPATAPGSDQAAAPPAADATAAGSSGKAADVAPKPVKPPEPALSIKFIKSGAGSSKPAPKSPAASAATPTPTVASAKPVAADAVPALVPEVKKPASPAPVAADSKPVAVTTPAKAELPKAESPVEVASAPETPPVEEEKVKSTLDQKKRKAGIMAKLRNRWRVRRDIETEDNSVQLFTGRSYVLAAIVIVGGIAFMWWRHGQRKLALEASAVSHSPFAAPVNLDPSAMFATEQIGKLGQKKFERLVASYYMKTGVVAERTNAEPTAPVHIKIFWKGEQKPFAGVQCHANPPALIPAKPLESLFEALTAADIRRGYVVTTGKFSVEARDYAAEKVFTLLSGDLFVEKLNALPPAARTELLAETNTEEPAVPA